MQTTTVSHLRKNLKKYLDDVQENHEPLIVPRGDEGSGVVIVSLKEYNALNETEYLLSTEANKRILQQSIAEMENNEFVSVDLAEVAARLNE